MRPDGRPDGRPDRELLKRTAIRPFGDQQRITMLEPQRDEAARAEDDSIAVDEVACNVRLENLTVNVHLPSTIQGPVPVLGSWVE